MTNTNALPDYLKENGLFCLWKYETRHGKPTKPPYNPHTLQYGDASDPAAFADLQAAQAAAAGFDGLGVGMFGDLAGIDIDHCIKDGELSEMAADVVLTMNAYTEISPSGEGLRILFLAPGMTYDTQAYYQKNSSIGLEVYIPGNTNRYLTVTGDVFNGGEVVDRSAELQAVLEKYMRRERPQAAAVPAPVPLDLEDREIIELAHNARNGAKFAALWNGDTAGYPSHSEADQALCNILAYWTGGNPERVDRLFRQSGLFVNEGRAAKWDKHHGSATYGEATIQKAIDGCPKFYRPPQGRAERPQAGAIGSGAVQYRPDENDPSNAPVAPRAGSVELFDRFLQRVQTEDYKPLQTGMQAFDRLLGGGITRQSLVVLSAAPGTGKTTLAQQIFETMARQGNPVFFLNLEMSREYLLARSLSRILHQTGYKMSASDVLRGYKWSEDQKAHVLEAAQRYRAEIAPHMEYNPHGNTTDIQAIQNTLDTFGRQAQAEGKPAPVVVLDYLHLVTGERLDAQEAVKKAVSMLKDYAMRYGAFVFAIGANNRTSNKSGVVSQDSGRDSSAIEYTADYQLSLNYAALADHETKTDGSSYRADNPDDMDELQMRDVREMVVQVLKNRMNKPGGKLYLNFDAAHSLFTPVEKEAEPQQAVIRI